jgi:AraC-like DNA-binding protein/quercetin dioxygenase-like cupin family protein
MAYRYRAEAMFPDPDFPVLIRKAAQRAREPMHAHEFVELVYVARGKGWHRVRYRTEQRTESDSRQRRHAIDHRIVAGDTFVIAPGEEHRYERTQGLQIYNVIFMPDVLRESFPQLRQVEGVFKFLLTEPIFRSEARFGNKLHLAPSARRRVEESLEVMREELSADRPESRMIVRARLAELIVRIGRACEEEPESAAKGGADLQGKHAAIRKAIEFMENQFAEPLTLENIAHQCYLSPHHFCRVFRETTGLSPWEHLTQVRLQAARERLIQTADSITSIALGAGFCDSSHFARVFREHEGMSATQFRKSQRDRSETT